MRYVPYALIAAFLALYAVAALRTPYGQWDAWATWNATARLLLYNKATDVYQFAGLGHKDYPPLWYLIISAGYRMFGDTPAVPIVAHGIVYAALLRLLRKPVWALAIVGMVALPYAVIQYADLPLSLVFLGAVAAYRHNRPLWVGFALGCGLLFKNEGALIAACFFAVWLLSVRRIPLKAVFTFAPFAVCLLLFKAVVNVPNDVIGSTSVLQRATDLSRYAVMIPLLLGGLVTFGGGALFVTGGVLWLERVRMRPSVPLVATALVFVGYVGIYAVTLFDLRWHITTSFDRLLIHLFPVVIYELTKAPN